MDDLFPPVREAVWRQALERLREVGATPDPARRAALVGRTREFFETSGEARLVQLARLLRPEMSDRDLVALLVPVERTLSRVRVTDADLGITTRDAAVAPDNAHLPLVVVADNIRSAFNVGGLFRTADAVGAEALWLCGYTATPATHPAVARSALGAETAVPWRTFPTIRDAIAELRSQGRALYALETGTDASPVQKAIPRWPAALLLGSERFGLDPEIVREADAVLRIDCFGRKNSLNVVCAFAVAAYAMRWSRNSDSPSP